MPGDEIVHLRIDLLAPAAAAEDAVVASALDGEVFAIAFGDAGTQLVRGARLAQAGDVVEFALDRHQRGVADRGRLHAFAGDIPEAARQQMFLEHHAHRVEVVVGRHVEHGVVFVVETAVRRGVVEIALEQVLVEIPMRFEMALRDRKSTRLNSSHTVLSRMPSSA